MWYIVPTCAKKLDNLKVKNGAKIQRMAYDSIAMTLESEGLVMPLGTSDRSVGKNHAEFRESDGQLGIRDLGTLNGTFVNHMPVKGWVPRGPATPFQTLSPGDRVRVGAQTEFKVEGDRSRVTVRTGETIQLPKEVVEELAKVKGFKSYVGQSSCVKVDKNAQSIKVANGMNIMVVRDDSLEQQKTNLRGELWYCVMAAEKKDVTCIYMHLDSMLTSCAPLMKQVNDETYTYFHELQQNYEVDKIAVIASDAREMEKFKSKLNQLFNAVK